MNPPDIVADCVKAARRFRSALGWTEEDWRQEMAIVWMEQGLDQIPEEGIRVAILQRRGGFDRIRRERNQPYSNDCIVGLTPDPASSVGAERLMDMEAAYQGLSQDQQIMLGMVAQGFTDGEVAEMFNVTATTLRSKKFRARILLALYAERGAPAPQEQAVVAEAQPTEDPGVPTLERMVA